MASSDGPDLYEGFPAGFFRRLDESPDTNFYGPPRLVTHIDEGAIRAVGDLYADLGIDGDAAHPMRVLDLMSSWVSHFRTPPAHLTVLGMNRNELELNRAAKARVVHDLNVDPTLPFSDGSFDGVVCCVSVDYLVHPIEVVIEAARVLVPGGIACFTFSNRCFPTKAIAGWLRTGDEAHVALVNEYVRRSGCFLDPTAGLRTPPATSGDPLYAVWAVRAPMMERA